MQTSLVKNIMKCCRCNRAIEPERISVLGHTNFCMACAKIHKPQRVVGYMEWSHKTAPTLRLTDTQSLEQFKQDTNRKGQSSILRSKMTAGGRLV